MGARERDLAHCERVLQEAPLQILLAHCFARSRWYDRRHERHISYEQASIESMQAIAMRDVYVPKPRRAA